MLYFFLIVNNLHQIPIFYKRKWHRRQEISHGMDFDLLNNTNLPTPTKPHSLIQRLSVIVYDVYQRTFIWSWGSKVNTSLFFNGLRNKKTMRENVVLLETILPDSFLLWWTKTEDTMQKMKQQWQRTARLPKPFLDITFSVFFSDLLD